LIWFWRKVLNGVELYLESIETKKWIKFWNDLMKRVNCSIVKYSIWMECSINCWFIREMRWSWIWLNSSWRAIERFSFDWFCFERKSLINLVKIDNRLKWFSMISKSWFNKWIQEENKDTFEFIEELLRKRFGWDVSSCSLKHANEKVKKQQKKERKWIYFFWIDNFVGRFCWMMSKRNCWKRLVKSWK